MSSPKTVLTVGNKCVVCQEAILVGEIVIEDGTVVHPKASIIAEGGPIIIGQNNIIEEQVVIKNSIDESVTEESTKRQKTMKIGSNNLFEVGAYIEAKQIGDANVFETKASVHSNTVIGSGCIIGAATKIPSSQMIADDTTVWGSNNNMKTQANNRENHLSVHTKHLEILQKTLPSFHHLKQKA